MCHAVMQLLRGLQLFAMEHTFHFSARHIAGKENGPADALTLTLTLTLTLPLPADLLQLFLAEHPPDWLSGS